MMIIKAKKFFSGDMTINLKAELDAIRREAIANRKYPDLLWRRLCNVVATSGSSVNAEAFMALYDTKLQFDLLPTTPAARKNAIYAALAAARVPRMREKKAQYLSDNYRKVKAMGGPLVATKTMLKLSGREAKQKWIRQFRGVGPKYSNDIWMSIYDPDFTDAIAIDTRVKNFATSLGFRVDTRQLEAELVEFARSCGLTGWDFDRLVYNFGSLIVTALNARGAARGGL